MISVDLGNAWELPLSPAILARCEQACLDADGQQNCFCYFCAALCVSGACVVCAVDMFIPTQNKPNDGTSGSNVGVASNVREQCKHFSVSHACDLCNSLPCLHTCCGVQRVAACEPRHITHTKKRSGTQCARPRIAGNKGASARPARSQQANWLSLVLDGHTRRVRLSV